jgi:sigma-B regulation protein RsbU (phosphoserine phosphatase)
MEADLAAARVLQEKLLPKNDPELPGLEIGIGFRPAAEVSGDVFDFFDLSEDRALIAFGDVSGKSAAAALYGAMVTGLLRTLAPRQPGPAALVQVLNEALIEQEVGEKYLTLLVMLWEPGAGVMHMANAAAAPPMVVRQGKFLTPHVEGFPLGLFPGRVYDSVSFQTEPGDLMLLCSDGILDQPNPEEIHYGEGRLAAFLPRVAHLDTQRIVDELLADVDAFRGSKRVHDDQTVLAIRIKGEIDSLAG